MDVQIVFPAERAGTNLIHAENQRNRQGLLPECQPGANPSMLRWPSPIDLLTCPGTDLPGKVAQNGARSPVAASPATVIVGGFVKIAANVQPNNSSPSPRESRVTSHPSVK
jgi:hypothetical protein